MRQIPTAGTGEVAGYLLQRCTRGVGELDRSGWDVTDVLEEKDPEKADS